MDHVLQSLAIALVHRGQGGGALHNPHDQRWEILEEEWGGGVEKEGGRKRGGEGGGERGERGEMREGRRGRGEEGGEKEGRGKRERMETSGKRGRGRGGRKGMEVKAITRDMSDTLGKLSLVLQRLSSRW